ncbi:MAG: bifunctional oligoribonuclease/PAP phosphatase NrnA [Bacilli bacterium]|nr:bifunctional oligoribonuclease/PAP phosphatase NrnA [Bacilli bacterium]
MSTFEELRGIIEQANTITIWGHALPDGDCYGSQIGLRDALRVTYPDKKVYAIGTGYPSLFELIGKMDEVNEDDIRESLAILVDVSCLRRVEDERVNLASSFMKFDHHNPNREHEYFDGPNFVDMHRIAAAEIIYDFLKENGMTIPVSSAYALYTGILTDSGGFLYFGTTKHTFEVGDELIELGADPEKIKDIVYHETPDMKAFKAYMCAHTKVYGQVAYCWINKPEYETYNLEYEVASSFVNAIANAKPNKVYAYFCEAPWGEIRVELRSNSGYGVQKTAAKFGGGGHTFAAGLSIVDGKPKLEEVLKALDEIRPYNMDSEA